MSNCNDCGTALKPLFGSKWFCPNDCDKKTVPVGVLANQDGCTKRWWTTIPKATPNHRHKKFYLYVNIDDINPNLHPYEVKLVGEYSALRVGGQHGRPVRLIVPGPLGVTIEPVDTAITANMKSFNDRATELAQKVINGTEIPLLLTRMLCYHVNAVSINKWGLALELKIGSRLIDLPPEVVKLAPTITALTNMGTITILKDLHNNYLQRIGMVP